MALPPDEKQSMLAQAIRTYPFEVHSSDTWDDSDAMAVAFMPLIKRWQADAETLGAERERAAIVGMLERLSVLAEDASTRSPVKFNLIEPGKLATIIAAGGHIQAVEP